MTLKNIYLQLKEKLLVTQFVERVDIYKDEVVYVDVRTEQLFFALDINVEHEVFLVCRNQESRIFLRQYFQYPIEFRTRIYAKNTVLVDFLANIEHSNLISVISDLIHQLLMYTRDEKFLFNNLNSNLIQATQLLKANRLNDVCSDMAEFLSQRFFSIRETLIRIKEQELSVARFGDGEIRCMVTTGGCIFQKHDWKLMQELRDISREKTDLLVCYPSLLIEDKFWNKFWSEFWFKCKFYIDQDHLGDAMISRPEAFYFYGQEIVRLWKDIWHEKNICFITGENSRLNSDHEIFSNIAKADYVFSKKQDAYDEIDSIFQQCLEKEKIDLFLIALGPAGTVLAARLHKLGLRGLDIGHLNNSYDTVFMNKARPEQV